MNPRWIEDVNGDGKADIVGFNADGVVVALSNGVNFDKATLWSWWFGSSADAGSWTNFDQFPRFVKDMNNDGKADIIGFGSAGIYIAYSNGKHFEEPFLAMSSFGAVSNGGGGNSYDRHPRVVMDVTGYGLFDIIGFGNAGTFVSVMVDDIADIKITKLNAIKSDNSLSDVKCLSEYESNELEINCFDRCKAESRESILKFDSSNSEGKFYWIWAWILLFGVLGVALLICFKKKSSKPYYLEFCEGSASSYMSLK
ncbi:unnamed protein product [Blepharisma stoltei]|uniref:VCBS repeat-containing protein n=1 Tax=Blepharisma stoltei TaxID=1481888 RepID=A0AAU9JNJ7_9CILI|nr:unnamed protein product [Blepharisma stoltei]